MSYAEVRRFLTSVAQQVTSSGAIVPAEIIPKEKSGEQPVGAGDNSVHNERTVDERRITHAMTSTMISPKTAEELTFPPIPRISYHDNVYGKCTNSLTLSALYHHDSDYDME